MISLITFNSMTASTSPTTFKMIGISLGIFMAIWTMGLLKIQSAKASTSMIVFLLSDRFKMVRIHTGSIFTEMIDMHSFWDWSFMDLIGISMRPFSNLLVDFKFSVSIIFRPNPFPTGMKRYQFNKIHKVLWGLIHKDLIAGGSSAV